MGILSDINPLGIITDIGGKLIDHFFPDPNVAAEKKLELMKLAQSGELAELDSYTKLSQAQLAVNQAEASNSSLFIAGWRPAVGWSCALAFAYNYVLQPLGAFVVGLLGYQVVLPHLDLSGLMPVLLGMLGLGGMRTYEKVKKAVGSGN